ncbi:hypothetical protein HID58_065887 [Brassica napus]|uniref:Uncharacterized protein n=1 Tax=Brassica napus TaxID=3708 RepID=A0ABQ7ZE54_BRANA|nr:hypothetical protein HID58_065887 [Brassica napus]
MLTDCPIPTNGERTPADRCIDFALGFTLCLVIVILIHYLKRCCKVGSRIEWSFSAPEQIQQLLKMKSFTLLRGNFKTQQITQEVRECTWTFSIIFPSSDLNFSDNNGRSLITRAHQLLMEGFNWWHVIRDTADPKTYTTATDQHGKENQAGLLNTTESFPLSPSENIDQTAKNKDILASWDDDDDV